ncbi:MAG: hypothetical protein HY908_21345 [Myxococcales bacterium]|nr:hypothetical protein [Myxococcales bacterium]
MFPEKPFPPTYDRRLELVLGVRARRLLVTGVSKLPGGGTGTGTGAGTGAGARSRPRRFGIARLCEAYAAGVSVGCFSADGTRAPAVATALGEDVADGEVTERFALALPAFSERVLAPFVAMADTHVWTGRGLSAFALAEEAGAGELVTRVTALPREPAKKPTLPFEVDVPRDTYLKELSVLVRLRAPDAEGRALEAISAAATAWAELAHAGAFSGGPDVPFSGAELVDVTDPYEDEIAVRLLSYHGGPDGWHALLRALACVDAAGIGIAEVEID